MDDAAAFMKSVGFALRYNATPSLPLAAMYQAAGDTRRAIEFTNALLASREVIETNVIAPVGAVYEGVNQLEESGCRDGL